jgi:hypothetical protein
LDQRRQPGAAHLVGQLLAANATWFYIGFAFLFILYMLVVKPGEQTAAATPAEAAQQLVGP